MPSINRISSIEKENNIEKSKIDVEKFRSDFFWDEYKIPQFNDEFIQKMVRILNNEIYWNLFENKISPQDIEDLSDRIKANNNALDIIFLESLPYKEKVLLSYFLYMIFAGNEANRFSIILENFWLGLLVWTCFYSKRNISDFLCGELHQINHDKYEYFKLLLKWIKEFIKKVDHDNVNIIRAISEFKLTKEIKDTANEIDLKDCNLWNTFSLEWLSIQKENRSGLWCDEKYFCYDTDKNWKSINTSSNGWNYTEIWSKLDRTEPTSHIDASGKQFSIFLDSPCGVVLLDKWEPICMVWFYITKDNDLFINQIQKVKYTKYDRYWRTINEQYPKILNDIDWKNILLKVSIQIAKKYGCKNLIIQWWENNKWTQIYYDENDSWFIPLYDAKQIKEMFWDLVDGYKTDNKKVHLSVEIAKKIYDELAQKNKFQYNNQTWNREKNIKFL